MQGRGAAARGRSVRFPDVQGSAAAMSPLRNAKAATLKRPPCTIRTAFRAD